MPEFDAIIVGAGPAGSACALTLARKSARVLLLEKGKEPGEKNVSGGVVYGGFVKGYGLVDLLPRFESEAPLQRKVTAHEVFLLGKPKADSDSYSFYRLDRGSLSSKVGFANVEVETGHDYTVLRREFDGWFASEAANAGATLSTSTTVLDLLKEDGRIAGVRTTREELRAKLVIDCAGVTSTMVESAGMRKRLNPRQLYHAAKRVYRLDPREIDARLNLKQGEGKASLFYGDFVDGMSGGGFLFTNKDTLSVGVIVSLDSLVRATTEDFVEVGKILDVQDAFEAHPMLAELLDGAEQVEYSAHNIPRSPRCLLKRPYGDGILVAGDALGAFVKIGPMLDGVRRAIATGIMAAQTFLEASNSGSFAARNLSRYHDLLAPIYEDVNRMERDAFIFENPSLSRIFQSVVFSTRLFVGRALVRARKQPGGLTATERVIAETNHITFERDESFPLVEIDPELALRSVTKPWVPACPMNCFTLVTSKGAFTSFRDLFEHNLRISREGRSSEPAARRRAIAQTKEDVALGKVEFNNTNCVSCGTCAAIGPETSIRLSHERDGRGVGYVYG